MERRGGPIGHAGRGRPALATLSLLIAFAFGATGSAAAGPRLLRAEREFGQEGVVRADPGPAFTRGLYFSAVTIEPDGSLLALRGGGRCCRGERGPRPFHLTPRGRVDARVPFPLARSSTVVRDFQGRWVRAINRSQLQRLEADGHPDPSFDRVEDGSGHWGSERAGFSFNRVLPLPSGEVLVAGGGRIARFRPDGKLDRDFGVEGEAVLSGVTGGWSGRVAGLLAVGDRTIVLANGPDADGHPGGPSRVLALDRLGRLDPAFAPATLPGPIVAFAQRAGGGVGIVWRLPTEHPGGAPTHNYVTVLEPDGTPDPSFGEGDGTTVLDTGRVAEPHTMLFLHDGSIAVGGEDFGADRRCWIVPADLCVGVPVVVRLAQDGTPIRGFGARGVRRLGALPDRSQSQLPGGVLSLAEDSSGDLIAAGGSGAAAFLARLDATGAPVPGFGVRGIVAERESRHPETTPYSVSVDSRGRILVGGESDARSIDEGPVVFRFRPDGKLDRGFGHGGFARFGGFAQDIGFVPDPNGGTYVIGATLEQEEWVTHLDSDGTPDRRFGTQGFLRVPLSSEFSPEAEVSHPLVGLPGGGLLIGGRHRERRGVRSLFELRRISSQGHLVRAFGHDGVLVLGNPQLRRFVMTDLASTADGGILVSGSIPKPESRSEPDDEFSGGSELAVVKLLPRGGLDRRFGHEGIATPRIPGETSARVVLGNPDGSVLVAAQQVRSNRHDPAYAVRRPLLLRLGRGGSVLQRFHAAPTNGEAPGYEAALHAHRMSDLIVSGGHVFVVSGEDTTLLTYSLQGRCEGYLPASPPGTESIVGATGLGRRLITAADFASGFTLRASRLR